MSPKAEAGSGADTSFLLRSRVRAIQVLLLTAALAGAGGWWAASLVKSPAEVAASAEPPPASVLTAPVELRAVGDALVTRGSVRALSSVGAIPQGVPPGVSRAIVTSSPTRAGQTLRAGDVVVEISGRPVFFLPGAVPTYRALRPGMTGPDVSQLQEALAAAGRSVSDIDGRFGPGTAAAVAGLYREHGYTPEPGGSVPESAITYVNARTATVLSSQAAVGQPADQARLELATGDLVVVVQASAAQSALLPEGEPVVLTSEVRGESFEGVITRQRSGVDGGVEVVIRPESRLPASWASEDVRVDVGETTGEQALAVPLGAMFLDTDGQASVIVVDESGDQTRVPVQAGGAGGGYVEVEPIDDALRPDDDVLIGVE